MLYSTLVIAASAFTGASAQFLLNNGTSYTTPLQCCTVPASSLPQARRDEICNAQGNTCVELCGGQGNTRTNNCDRTSLSYTCTCSNSTSLSTQQLAPYQQTVPGLVCRDWFDRCINSTGSDAQQQFQCRLARDEQCGNLTTRATATSSGSSPSATGSQSSGGGSPSSSGTAASPAASAGVAANLAMYGTPILAAGLMAVFGVAL